MRKEFKGIIRKHYKCTHCLTMGSKVTVYTNDTSSWYCLLSETGLGQYVHKDEISTDIKYILNLL